MGYLKYLFSFLGHAMMNFRSLSLLVVASLVACSPAANAGDTNAAASAAATAASSAGSQAGVQDNESMPNVVKVAVGSKDHTTLVAALQAADLVNSLANAGPFTVFAPTNVGFDKLPAGTVETLLKPKNILQLKGILQHHVTTSALDLTDFTDGQALSMADGNSATITMKDGATFIDGAKVIGSVRASNGWVHVIDAVVVPKAK